MNKNYKRLIAVLIAFFMLIVAVFPFGFAIGTAKAKSTMRFGLIPSWKNRLNYKHITVGYVNPSSLPPSVDLSSLLPPIGDQGQQGSCVAWAVGYYYKTFVEHVEQNWDVTTDAHQFSPAFIYNQINGGHDNGSSFPDAFQLLEDKGCDTLKIFPYNDQDYTTQPTEEQLKLATPFKIQDYGNLFYGRRVDALYTPSKHWEWKGTALTDQDIYELKDILNNGSVFVIGIPVFETWYRSNFGPNDYIHYVPQDGEVTFYGYHAVTLVGYDDNVHGGSFRMVNSWGPNWGDHGYTWITYDWIKQCAEEGWQMQDKSPDFTVTVVQPNGGEHLSNGSTYTIKWNSSDAGGGNAEFAQYANIFYLQNNHKYTIANHINNTGSYNWTVPSGLSGDIKIEVDLLDSTYFTLATDQSDGIVHVGSSAPTVTLTSPNGGETLTAGSTYTVTWTVSGDTSLIDHISVDYSTDGGNTWHCGFVVFSGFSSNMSHNWTVPNVSSTNCKLRIGLKRTNGTVAVDFSDNVFAIQQP